MGDSLEGSGSPLEAAGFLKHPTCPSEETAARKRVRGALSRPLPARQDHLEGTTPAPSGHASKGRPRLRTQRQAESSPLPAPARGLHRLTEAAGPAHTQPRSARDAHSPAAAPQEGCYPPAARLTNGSTKPRRQIRFKIAHQPITEEIILSKTHVSGPKGAGAKRNEHAHHISETPGRGHFD